MTKRHGWAALTALVLALGATATLAGPAVAKTKKDHRNYTLLNDLNTQPRTTYLAGLKNQNKEMPDHRDTIMTIETENEAEVEDKNRGGESH